PSYTHTPETAIMLGIVGSEMFKRDSRHSAGGCPPGFEKHRPVGVVSRRIKGAPSQNGSI
ncbi:hypothetical protein ACFXO7_33690, partial [Nocardia tengchongensis]|uniref:hypothetical protein n=1 Tax=Nocardia tengchongensis TaxID=2055889 RepID=UPI00369579B3